MLDEQDTEIGAAVRAILAARYQPKVGDRVRIRVSGECLVHWGASYMDGHPFMFDGMEGTVISDDLPPVELDWGRTHPIPVRFDESVWAPVYANGDYTFWVGNYFTPTELELVQP